MKGPVVVALLLITCGGQQPASTLPAERSPIDSPGHNPVTRATVATPCGNEIVLDCGAGTIDGCVATVTPQRLTTHHACVAEGSEAGLPCEQAVELLCAEGTTDACFTRPPLAATHVCVKKF